MELPFAAEASDELLAAVAFYEERRPGYGRLFYSEIRRAARRAAQFPHSGTTVSGFRADLDVRRYVVRWFPYRVITASVAGRQAVVAVAHGSRDPGYWHRRVTDDPPAAR